MHASETMSTDNRQLARLGRGVRDLEVTKFDQEDFFDFLPAQP